MTLKELNKQSLILIFTFIIGTIWMIVLLFQSDGTALHDEIGHYLLSRDAIKEPMHIFDLWGRTVNTLIYILPAQFGLGLARLTSLFFALLTVFFVFKVSVHFRLRYAYLVPILLWAQPWFPDLSYMCITQVPFSLIMILGTYLFLKNKHTYAALIIGLLPLIRHEGIALVGLVTLYMLYKRNWVAAISTTLPLFLFNGIYFILQGTIPFMLYFDAQPNTLYGSGTWYHFLIRLPHPRAVGIPISLITICSLFALIKQHKKLSLLFPILFWYGSYLVLHVAIFRFGLFASGGYKMFLLPLAPMIAILAVLGVERITEFILDKTAYKTNLSNTFLSRNTLIPLLVGGCALFAFLQAKPYHLSNEEVAIKQAVQWIKKNRIDISSIVATHVYFYHMYPKKVPPKTLWEKYPPLPDLPLGTIVIWDNKYSDKWQIPLEYFLSHPQQWKELQSFEGGLAKIFKRIS